MFARRVGLLVILVVCIVSVPSEALGQTVGLFTNEPGSSVGYTLFSPRYTTSYLIDNEGRLVNSWDSAFNPGQLAYLLENGNLLRGAELGGNATFTAPGGGGAARGVCVGRYAGVGVRILDRSASSPSRLRAAAERQRAADRVGTQVAR